MWIHLTDEEAAALPKALEPVKKRKAVKALLKHVADEAAAAENPDVQKIIQKAADKFGCEGDSEIQVDSDAVVSESDEHSFVMMWGYVTHKEAGLATDDDDEDTEDEQAA